MECIEENAKDQAQRVEQMQAEWKLLWKERLDDKVRAEGIANKDYSLLSVEKGTVITATRDFKPLSLKVILEEHGMSEVYKFVSPSPDVGGWGKFIRKSIVQGRSSSNRLVRRCVAAEEKNKPQQLRKCGRGWLHR